MDTLARFPERALTYIQYNYGWLGFLFVGLIFVMGIVTVYTWMDRRR
jgi:hypothetical protein